MIITCAKCKKETPVPDGAKFCPLCGANQVKLQKSRKPKARGNQTGTVFKRGKTYRVEVTIGKKYSAKTGKIVPDRRTKDGFLTKREAYDYVPILKAQKQAENKKTISTLREHWNTYSTSQMLKLSANKQGAYTRAFKHLKSLCDRPVNTITIAMLQALVDEKAPTFYPARDIKVLLSHLYKRAMAQQDATVNLSEFIILPELEEDEPVPFTEKELKSIWKAYGKGDKIAGYILLMTYSGMMPGELFKAEKDMIDFDKQTIIGCGLKTKKRKETPIVVADIVIPVLKDLCEYSNSKNLIDMRRDVFYNEFHETLKRCGCADRTPYVCRHTTATALSLGDIAPEVIKEVMRHTKFDTTKRYIHKDIDTAPMLEAVNKLKK